MTAVRPARAEDAPVLRRIDERTWSSAVTPASPPPPGEGLFEGDFPVDDVLVAEVDGVVAGYVLLARSLPIASHAHVLEIGGLAVDPQRQGAGVGRALVLAAVDEARARGARKLSLRVLGPNDQARRVYAACGFETEGVLRGEFHLDNLDVDDVLMARYLSSTPSSS